MSGYAHKVPAVGLCTIQAVYVRSTVPEKKTQETGITCTAIAAMHVRSVAADEQARSTIPVSFSMLGGPCLLWPAWWRGQPLAALPLLHLCQLVSNGFPTHILLACQVILQAVAPSSKSSTNGTLISGEAYVHVLAVFQRTPKFD